MPIKAIQSTVDNQIKKNVSQIKLTAANLDRYLNSKTFKPTQFEQDKDEVGSGICYNRWKPKN